MGICSLIRQCKHKEMVIINDTVDILAVCNPACETGKGRCVSPNTCRCSNPTYTGLTCGQCKKLYLL